MFYHSQTKVYLRRNAEERAAAAGVNLVAPKSLVAQLPAPGSKITKDELEDVSPISGAYVSTLPDISTYTLSGRITQKLSLTHHSFTHIFFFSSRHMSIHLSPTFLQFLRYIFHVCCPSNSFIPYSVQLCDYMYSVY